MSAKLGRPKLENPNTLRISVRINQLMLNELDRYCDEYNISSSEALRRGFDLLLKQEKRRKKKEAIK